jgi:hypothetical protein
VRPEALLEASYLNWHNLRWEADMAYDFRHGHWIKGQWLGMGWRWLSIVGLTGLSLVMAADPLPQTIDKATGEVTLLREGTRLVEEPAICRSSGDRLLITLGEQSAPLVALENLAAQRILKAVLDDVGDDRWIVGGQITEFQERNYLLLDRVVRQPKLPR